MLRLLLAVVLAFAPMAAAAQRKVQTQGFSYAIDKVPGWVRAAPAPTEPRWSGRSSVRYPLVDVQVNLTGSEPVRFTRVRRFATEPAGLSTVSEIRIHFNPAYENVVLHQVAVVRDGKRTERLSKIKLTLLQRESRLERSIYDGVVTAFAPLEDVRIGDIVEYSYSVRGANPVFDGKFSGFYTLNYIYPMDVLRVRLEHPASRSLRTKVIGLPIAPQVSRDGERAAVEVRVSGLPPVVPEDVTPAWASHLPELQVTEFADWAEVRKWAAGHYRRPEAGPAITRLAEQMRAEGGGPEELAVRALAFVQDEIRYFAVATGTSSHRPSPPAETLARRYGDCKDKTMLLLALLAQLGIEARPALVSNDRRRQLAELLPSPDAFDHVIVSVRLGGRTLWLDPTRSYQARSLAALGFESFDRALLVDEGQAALTAVEPMTGYEESIRIVERFSVKNYGGPATLKVIGVHGGGQAERMRAWLASNSAEIVENALAADVLRRYPGAKVAAPVETADERARNQLIVTERYELPRFFAYEHGYVRASFYASAVGMHPPEHVKRSYPLALAYPMSGAYVAEFELPAQPASFRLGQPVSIAGPHFEFGYRGRLEGRLLAFEYAMRTRRDHVAPYEMPGYLERLDKMREHLSRTVHIPVYDYERVEAEIRAAAAKRRQELAGVPELVRDELVHSLAGRMRSEASIASGLLDGEHLARAWREVASELIDSGERQKALEVLDKALQAHPDAAPLYRARAAVLAHSGKFDAALADVTRALASVGDEPGLPFLHGQVLHFLGRYQEAADVLAADAGRTAGREQSYRLLWLYMAGRGLKADSKDLLRRAGYSGERAEWPGPIIAYLLDEIPAAALFEIAREDGRETDPRLCEAWFFIAQRRLFDGDAGGAKVAFENALRTQVIPYIEHAYASVELQRLR